MKTFTMDFRRCYKTAIFFAIIFAVFLPTFYAISIHAFVRLLCKSSMKVWMPAYYVGIPNVIQIRLPSRVTSYRFLKWRRVSHRIGIWWHHSLKNI